MDFAVERILRQYASAKSHRGTWENQWQIIADYGLGRREFVTQWREGGRPRQTRIFDAIFQKSADELAAALQSLLVSGSAQWHKLYPEDPKLLEIDEVDRYFKDITILNYASFNDPEANFSPQLHETLLDVVGFGTGCLYTDDFDGKVGFSSRPLGECYAIENSRGRIDTVFRKFRLSVRNAFEMWGEGAGRQIAHEYEAGNYDAEYEFVHCVMPREHAHPSVFSPQHFPWGSYYVNVQERSMIEESGYPENPYSIARWSKDSGEHYGRGPGYNAIADTKMLNRMSRTILVAAEKAADPPLMISDDGVLAPPRTEPGGRNIVRASMTGGRAPMEYLVNQQRTDLTQERYTYVANQIRGHFYHELLQTFDDPRMSATQILELASRTAKAIGPMVFRLQTELLEPTVDRVVGLNLRRRNFFPPPPDVLRGTVIRARYISPAAIQQLNADVQGIQTIVGSAQEWAQTDPDVIDNIDFDEALKQMAESFGNAHKILRPESEVKEIRDAKDQASDEQAALMAAQGQQGAGPGMGGPPGNQLPI